jgi:hypothetical protein
MIGQALDGENGNPTAIGRETVLNRDGTHVVPQYIGGITARDPQMDLVPAAVIGSQRIVYVAVTIPYHVGQGSSPRCHVRPGIPKLLGTGSPRKWLHTHQSHGPRRSFHGRNTPRFFPNDRSDQVWIDAAPLSILNDNILPTTYHGLPIRRETRSIRRLVTLCKHRVSVGSNNNYRCKNSDK